MHPIRVRTLAAWLALAGVAPVFAADWQTIATDKQRKVEIDRASVLQSDPGTKIAWGRISLTGSAAAEAGYALVKALNRYDCNKQTFSTIKRVFLDEDSLVVKEERIRNEKPVAVAAGTVDERLWREVCRPGGGSLADLSKVAEAAGQAASRARGEVRTADYRPAEEGKPVTRKASDAREVDEPAAKKPQSIDKPLPPARGDRAERTEQTDPAPRPVRPDFIQKPPRPSKEELEKQVTPDPRPAYQPSYMAPPRRVAPRPRPRPKPVSMEPAQPPAYHEVHWSYEGEGGPANWGMLKPEWKLCATGERQSPIDIRDGVKVDLEPIRFDYKPSYFRIIDNGHTIQASFGQGNTISVMGRMYDLVQVHFHRPSEERINGRGYEMVAHLVHKDLDGRLAVVAVLLERGQDHPVIQTLWNNLPLERNVDYTPQAVLELPQLLPADRSYYTYMGSLTTPPCSEGVLWMVMKQPVQVSAEQIAIFSRLYPMNARPVQSVKGRLIKESR